MADFTNKASMGTNRINPSSMVPGARGNAPQGGFRTQMKRSPSGGAEGSGGAPQMSQYNQLAQQLAQAQNTAPPQGVVPKVSNTNPFAQSLPLSAAKPMGNGGGVVPRVTLPMQPNAGTPFNENDYVPPRMSSAKNGPTPIQHIPSGNWWENAPGTAPQEQTPDSSFLGPWALNNEPMRQSQSDLPPEKQQMLGTAKKGRSFKADDFNMLSAIFKTLGEQ